MALEVSVGRYAGLLRALRLVGRDSGGGIRTRDLRVMSPTSYQTAPPRGGLKILATELANWASRKRPAEGLARACEAPAAHHDTVADHRFVANPAQRFDVCVLFRYRVLAHASAMASLRQKILAERTVRELLERNGLPEPDEVEYGYGCVRLLFHEPKTALIIDIDRPDDEDEIDPEERSLDADMN